MDNVAIIGTVSDHGGTMITATGDKFKLSGNNACVLGDIHHCPQFYDPGTNSLPHGDTPIVSQGAIKCTINGIPVVMQGSVAGCGAVLISNFANHASIL